MDYETRVSGLTRRCMLAVTPSRSACTVRFSHVPSGS